MKKLCSEGSFWPKKLSLRNTLVVEPSLISLMQYPWKFSTNPARCVWNSPLKKCLFSGSSSGWNTLGGISCPIGLEGGRGTPWCLRNSSSVFCRSAASGNGGGVSFVHSVVPVLRLTTKKLSNLFWKEGCDVSPTRRGTGASSTCRSENGSMGMMLD